MAVPYCPGEVVDVAGLAECQDELGDPIAWESVPTFNIDQVDPTVATAAYAGGFVIVGIAWAIGWACRALLDMIRR